MQGQDFWKGEIRQRPTLPHSYPCSTIGAEGLYFRVRDGNGCGPFAIAAENSENYQPGATTFNNDMIRQAGVDKKLKVKPHDRLVLLDFTRYRASICSLSTSSSSTGLWGTIPGSANLEVGFPLRCIQRLSNPYIATQRCSWRHNWHTRGTSIPVLSY